MKTLNIVCKNLFLCFLLNILIGCGHSNNKDSTEAIPDPIPEDTKNTRSTPPALINNYYSYGDEIQKIEIDNISNTEAVAVVSFQNSSSSSGEGNIQVTDYTLISAKENSPSKETFPLIESNDRYSESKRNNYTAPLKYSKRNIQREEKKGKLNRASAALGSRDTFYHDEGSVKGNKSFEKIYSGAKCLIYAEVDTATDLPYVNQTRGKVIGDAFEINNPYNSTGKPIFDLVTEVFGNPWGISESGELINGGGRDGEEQVLLLLYKGKSNTYGYFYWVDEEEKGYVNSDDSYTSNGAEIVFLNEFYANDDIAILGTISHEFQHLCDYNQKFILNGNYTGEIYDSSFDGDIPTLFNEGQSVLSEELNGFGLRMANNKGNDFIFNSINSYLSKFSTSPSFYTFTSSTGYGKGYLFWRYLYDSYGESVLINATHSSLLQPNNIEFATSKKMDVLLQEFMMAILYTDSSAPSQSTYKITTINRSIPYFDTTGVSQGFFDPITYLNGFQNNVIKSEAPYVLRLYKLLPNSNGQVKFTLENLKSESSFSIFTAKIDK